MQAFSFESTLLTNAQAAEWPYTSTKFKSSKKVHEKFDQWKPLSSQFCLPTLVIRYSCLVIFIIHFMKGLETHLQ